jgi:hypothetical protein
MTPQSPAHADVVKDVVKMKSGIGMGIGIGIGMKAKLEATVLRSYACGTKTGRLSSSQEKENQDTAILEQQLGNRPDTQFFAVADGHGVSGSKVSFLVKLSLPRTSGA